MFKNIVFFISFLILSVVIVGFVESDDSTSCQNFKLSNGRMRIKPKGKLARFQCNKGFQLVGEKYSYCSKGKFDVPPPICVKPTCSIIKPLLNGYIYPFYNGAVANFYCKPGYTLRGANMTYCDGNKWVNNLPTCLSTHTPTPTACDFETEDLCGWSHDLNHDFDWRRQNFETPSGHIGTGPKFDHTKGPNNNGYYVYIESTSRVQNDKARLISPIYNKMDSLCFSFYYHMYGTGIGQLRVYIKKISEKFERLKPLFSKSGNKGDIWLKGRIIIEDGISDDFQIIIEGVRGSSYISDIAVDDVSLTEYCEDDETEISTTTDLTTDEEVESYGSCLNRCEENNTEIIFGDVKSCECNENCYERNTCCPDYVPVCLIDTFYFTSEMTSTYLSESDSTTNSDTTLSINLETTQNDIKTTLQTAKTNKLEVLTTKATLPTKTSEIINITNLPPIIVTTLRNTKTPSTMTTEQPTSTTAITKIDEPINENFPIKVETDYEATITTETFNITDTTPLKIMQNNDSNLTLIIFCVSGLVLMIIVLPIVIFVNRSVKCHNLRYRNSRNGESMSDVRFLAGDEVLDFTWRSADS